MTWIAIGLVLGVLLGVWAAFAHGPFGLRAEYRRLVRQGAAEIARAGAAGPVTEADLAPLPEPVRRYLRLAGVIGTPRPRGFRARMTGRIRGALDAPWMPFVAEQHNVLHPPRRLFWMEARRSGLPVEALHVYDRSGASMRVRVLSLLPVVDLSGPVLTRGETVTVLNDMCFLAPGSLVDPALRWRPVDGRTVDVTYTAGEHEVRATLLFDASGALVDFRSDDRPALAPDGVTLLQQRWSTPLGAYRQQGPYRLASRGEARYDAPGGAYAYIEAEIVEVTADPVR